MFSYACNLLKMDDALSTNFQQCFKKDFPRNPVNTSRADHIRSDFLKHYNHLIYFRMERNYLEKVH